MTRGTLAGLAPAVMLALTGCEPAPGDDGAPAPRATVTLTQTPEPVTPVPATVPAGAARFDPSSPSWSTGDRLVVGDTSVPLAPRRATAFVLAEAGVYFLDGREVWFTDLRRIRATGLIDVTGLALDRSGRHLLVDLDRPGGTTAYAFDTRTGRQVPATGLVARSSAQPRDPIGPGRYALAGGDGTPLRVVDGPTDRGRALQPPTRSLRLAGWSGPRTFYGFEERTGRRPVRMLGCDAATARCRSLGALPPGSPVILEGTGPAVPVIAGR